MKRITHARRATLALSALVLTGALGACNDLLEVDNPGVIVETDLADSTLVNELAAAAPGTFNAMYAGYALGSAVITDEAVSGDNFTEWQDVDARIITDANAGYGGYVNLHRVRFLGQNTAARISEFLGAERAAKDARVAEAHLAEAYATLLLAESHCESPLTGEDAAKSSQEIFQVAIAAFEKALTVGGAAAADTAYARITGTQGTGAYVVNTARVGIARTYLNLGNKAKALEFASQVPANFVALAVYSDTRSDLYNPFEGQTTGTLFRLGVDPKFQNLNDPRIRHRTAAAGHNGGYPISVPWLARPFTGWNPAGTSTNQVFGRSTDIEYASRLEAEYIIAEAQGLSGPGITFLNTRRAVGNQTPLANTISEAEFRTALLDQRARDFYLSGRRLGDLRRFKAQYGIDAFPKGDNPNPGPAYVEYGTAECFRPTTGERIGNPNYNP